MNILILYDSKFGNTQRLATAMADAVTSDHQVATRPMSGAPTDATDFDLVLVGGPTQVHGASPALKDALGQLPAGSLVGVRVAAFDTRIRIPKVLSGSAAGVAGKLVRAAGAEVVSPPESFFVTRDSPPVLEAGEVVRASTWAHDLVARFDHPMVAPA